MAYCFQDLVHRRVLKKQTESFDKCMFSSSEHIFLANTFQYVLRTSTRFHLTTKTSFLRSSVLILMQLEGKRSERITSKTFYQYKQDSKTKHIFFVHTRHLSQLGFVR